MTEGFVPSAMPKKDGSIGRRSRLACAGARGESLLSATTSPRPLHGARHLGLRLTPGHFRITLN
jgi:hypothetical protein